MSACFANPTLPWTSEPEEDRRFRRILLWMLAAFLLLSLVMPFLPVPQRAQDEVPEVPRRIAELVLERQQPPPPPEPRVEEPVAVPEPVPAPAPVPAPVTETPPAPAPERPAVQEAPPQPSARERAQSAGVLAFSEDLSRLRNSATTEALRTDALSTGGTTENRQERSVITARTGGASGGINTSTLSRDTAGGGALAGRATQQVVSSVDGGGSGDAAAVRRAQQRQGSRTDEEIQLVFDRNKSAIYTIYNRALRTNPTLRGKLVLRLTIQPSGQISAADIVSSELRDEDLERRLVLRVRQLDFGAKDVSAITITYPIDFFPS